MTRKKRTLVILGSTLLLAVLAIFFVMFSTKKSTLKQDYHVENVNGITKIFMADKYNQQVLMTKNADSTWTIDSKYKGNLPKIHMLLGTLEEMRIKYPVSIAAKDNAIRDIAASGTKIEIYEQGYFIDLGKIKLFPREKLTKTIYVGRETQDNLGTLMFKENDKRGPMVVHIPGFRGFLTPRFIANPRMWYSQEIFNTNVFAIQQVKVEIPTTPEQSYTVTKTPDNSFNFTLADGSILNRFDSNRVANFLTSFTNANFDQIAIGIPQEEKDIVFAKGPQYIVTLTDTAGKTMQMKTFGRMVNPYSHVTTGKGDLTEVMDVNKMYATFTSMPDTVLIQYYVFDNMLQPAGYFIIK